MGDSLPSPVVSVSSQSPHSITSCSQVTQASFSCYPGHNWRLPTAPTTPRRSSSQTSVRSRWARAPTARTDPLGSPRVRRAWGPLGHSGSSFCGEGSWRGRVPLQDSGADSPHTNACPHACPDKVRSSGTHFPGATHADLHGVPQRLPQSAWTRSRAAPRPDIPQVGCTREEAPTTSVPGPRFPPLPDSGFTPSRSRGTVGPAQGHGAGKRRAARTGPARPPPPGLVTLRARRPRGSPVLGVPSPASAAKGDPSSANVDSPRRAPPASGPA